MLQKAYINPFSNGEPSMRPENDIIKPKQNAAAGIAGTPRNDDVQCLDLSNGIANANETKIPVMMLTTNVGNQVPSSNIPPKTPGASDHAKPLLAPNVTMRGKMLIAPNEKS